MKPTLLLCAVLFVAVGTEAAAQPSPPAAAPAPSAQGQPQQQFDPAVPRVLYRIPGQEKARVQKDVVYKRVGAAELKMDVYWPADAGSGVALPAILFLSGASETKHWGVYTSYGELTAAQGMIAVQFDKRYPPGEAGLATAQEDINDLIAFLRQNAARFGIDRDRLCLWGFSAGGTLVSAGMLPDQTFIRCLVSYYGIGQLGPRRQVTALGDKLPPMLVVRAGLDNPVLNNAVDLFIQEAINKNIRIDFYNYPDGHHAFDIFDDKERTREIIRNTFQFIRQQLAAGQSL
ncbi:MAG TPA: alpha/beta hydrolase [Pyrinomonadaceae bacterium]|jgi:acetyl esterase/lipase|nr:alpha/beta hydrolase [Pyrinomonadaceae bacterium]